MKWRDGKVRTVEEETRRRNRNLSHRIPEAILFLLLHFRFLVRDVT